MTNDQVKAILKSHEKWLRGESGGQCANFECASIEKFTFRHVDFTMVSFTNAKLENVVFSECTLRDVDFENSDMHDVVFTECNALKIRFEDASLSSCTFYRTDASASFFFDASLNDVDFIDSNLRASSFALAKLKNVSFARSNLSGATLGDAQFLGPITADVFTSGYWPVCPTEGEFIAWKKCAHGTIVKLKVPADARRSSATTRKCRCDKAEVLEIFDSMGNNIPCTRSAYDHYFTYRVGDVVTEPAFNTNRWVECSEGIHFFMSREEAEAYEL